MQSIVSKVPTFARVFLGLLFTVFGLNGFLGFIPQPEPTADGGAFLGALAAAGYMFPLIKGTEVVAGVLLLSNRFVPLALTLLAPVTVNILAYHLVLDPAPGMAIVINTVMVFLAYSYRDSFRSVLQAKAEPAKGLERRSRSHLGSLRSEGV
jgi:hypothetical protein